MWIRLSLQPSTSIRRWPPLSSQQPSSSTTSSILEIFLTSSRLGEDIYSSFFFSFFYFCVCNKKHVLIIFPETLQYDTWCTFLCLQGILFSTPECLKAPMDFVRLWLHEASRVYGDKLIEEKDMELFSKMKFNIAKDSFEVMHALTLFVILAKLYYLLVVRYYAQCY